MSSTALLVDAFGRVREEVEAAVDGLTPAQLAYRVDADANSVAWLVWHLTRVEDDHVADAAGFEQVWTADGWCDRFGLPFDPVDTGYGHSSSQVGAVQAPADLLRGYQEAVHAKVVEYVEQLIDADLPRIVDERWQPPVSLGVRLVSVIGDGLSHAGQAQYARGILERAGVR